MGVGGTNFTSSSLIRIGLLFAAFVLALISLFTGWWTIQADVTGSVFGQPVNRSDSTSVGPFDDGDTDDEELGSSAVVTGILAVLALVVLVGSLAVEVLEGLQRKLAPLYRLVVTGATVLFGLAAILYALFAFPAAVDGVDGFWDKQTFSSGGTRVETTFYAGGGWYLAIAGFVALPLAATVLWMRTKEPEAAPMPSVPRP